MHEITDFMHEMLSVCAPKDTYMRSIRLQFQHKKANAKLSPASHGLALNIALCIIITLLIIEYQELSISGCSPTEDMQTPLPSEVAILT